MSRGVHAALVCAAIALGGCSGELTSTRAIVPAAVSGPQGPLQTGKSYEDPNGWIEYGVGDAPLIIIAPHGGTLTPASLRVRSCADCVTVNDLGTQELARAVVDAFTARTGARPHLVVNRLHRRHFDGNRAQPEASDGQSALAAPFTWMQAAIDSASSRTVARFARGLVIDLHGHAHDVARLELGYLLTSTQLRRSDAALVSGNDMSRSSIARLAAARPGDGGTALLRGPVSLGALLTGAGYPSVPSPAIPAPLIDEPYFDGGYNTRRNGSVDGGPLDAIQIETHYVGVRDSAASRARFADALAAALVRYLESHYGWRPS